MFVLRASIWCYAACALAIWLQVPVCAELPVWMPQRPAPTLAQQPIVSAAHYLPSSGGPSNMLGSDASYCLDNSYQPQQFGGNSIVSQQYFDPSVTAQTQPTLFELLPSDVIWHSYWAGAKESRTSAVAFNQTGDDTSLLDVSLGGRTAMFRDATRDQHGHWRGWELQIEGAAILRLNLDEDWDFDSADFRFGVPLILARDQVHWKLAYYHLSSHVGDEFLVRNPTFSRINFSRDVLVAGASYFPVPAVRLYGETGFAFYDDEGSDPWEFQFGLDFAQPGPTDGRGTPFLALNGHLREEVNFGGNFALQAGWLWRGQTGRVIRTGLHYYNGKSPQYEFFDTFEQQIGFGLWQEY